MKPINQFHLTEKNAPRWFGLFKRRNSQ